MRLNPKNIALARQLAGAKVGDKVNLGGLPVTIVSNEEAEEMPVVVCSRVNKANVYGIRCDAGKCGRCGHEIFISPSSPKAPTKICLRCLVESRGNLTEEIDRQMKEVGE